jgi:hypothetical protein
MRRFARSVLACAAALAFARAAESSPPLRHDTRGPDMALEVARRMLVERTTAGLPTAAQAGGHPDDARWAGGFGAPTFDRPPRAAIEFGGDLVVGGDFTRIGDVRCPGAMRWNGAVWEAMGEGPGGTVWAFAIVQGILVAAGSFHDPASDQLIALKQWNGSTWVPFGPFLRGTAYALAVDGATVYVTGFLFGGGFGHRVLRLEESGWTPLGGPVQGDPLALAVWNGMLVLGGHFDSVGGAPMRGLASWDGAAWSEFGGGLTGNGYDAVFALAVWQGGLVAGGFFTEIGGQPISTVARWSGTGWAALGSPVLGGASALLADGGTLHVGGSLAMAGGSGTVFSTDGVAWSYTDEQPVYSVSALAKVRGDLVAAGNFYAIASTLPPRPTFWVARRSGSSWLPLETWSPAFEGFMGYYGPRLTALAEYRDQLLVGGPVFARAEDSAWGAVSGIGTWDGNVWRDLEDVTVYSDPSFVVRGDTLEAFGPTSGMPLLNAVSRYDGARWEALGQFSSWGALDLAMFAGRLHAVGYMSFGFEPGGYRLAQWTGSDWILIDPGFFTLDDSPGYLSTLATHAGKLYVAGDFERVGTTYARGIAAWDGTTWSAVGGGVTGIETMLSYAGRLWVGGTFFDAGGVEAYGLASWDGQAWSGAGLSGGTNTVLALGTYDGALVAGGFELVSGTNRFAGLAVRDRGGWHGFGSGIEGWVHDVQQIGTSLYVAGSFATAGGKPSYGLARWDGGVPDRPPRPARLALASANPFAHGVDFAFTMPAPGRARLTIHDLAGREVGRLIDGAVGGGYQTARWTPRADGAHPGIYVARLVASGTVSTVKLAYLP